MLYGLRPPDEILQDFKSSQNGYLIVEAYRLKTLFVAIEGSSEWVEEKKHHDPAPGPTTGFTCCQFGFIRSTEGEDPRSALDVHQAPKLDYCTTDIIMMMTLS